jgi:hypothetical protein
MTRWFPHGAYEARPLAPSLSGITMLLQNSATLENEVVKLLSQCPEGLTAEEIRAEVSRTLRPYSRRGVYKELQRLINEGILVRGHSVYSLRLAWLLSLHTEIERIARQIGNPEYLKSALPSRGQPVVLHASNLVNWDRQWTQMMLMMHTLFPKLPMFIWCPRHWFTLTHPEIESTFTHANETKRNLRYAIIGGRSFLDLRDRSVIKSTCFSFRISPFEYDRNHYYWIVGDYVGINTLDALTVRQIDEIYAQTKRETDITPLVRRRLLSRKCRGTVKCEWAPEKAEKLRGTFSNFFGVKTRDNGELLTTLVGEI